MVSVHTELALPGQGSGLQTYISHEYAVVRLACGHSLDNGVGDAFECLFGESGGDHVALRSWSAASMIS